MTASATLDRSALPLLPAGLALLGLGAGVAAVTFLSLAQDDVSYARTLGFVLVSLLLAAPSLVLYAASRAAPGPWWRFFWTAALAAYLLHLWWAVERTYLGDIGAIFERQGWVAWSNVLVTLLWIADVAVSWTAFGGTRAAGYLRFAAWLLVAISFIVASVVFRTGTVALAGGALTVAILIALAYRWWWSRPA
jgi:hypothetical protein